MHAFQHCHAILANLTNFVMQFWPNFLPRQPMPDGPLAITTAGGIRSIGRPPHDPWTGLVQAWPIP
jgi:hypothetical protein